MFSFLKILEVFVFRVLINKEEYSLNSKKFNPLKILVIIFLNFFPFFTVYLYIQLSDAYIIIKEICPVLEQDINKGLSKEELLVKIKKEKLCYNK